MDNTVSFFSIHMPLHIIHSDKNIFSMLKEISKLLTQVGAGFLTACIVNKMDITFSFIPLSLLTDRHTNNSITDVEDNN